MINVTIMMVIVVISIIAIIVSICLVKHKTNIMSIKVNIMITDTNNIHNSTMTKRAGGRVINIAIMLMLIKQTQA